MSGPMVAMGGGSEVPVKLTADLCARAIIAAARAYGDDPVRAMTAERGVVRRAVTPAADGLARALDLPVKHTARVFGIRVQNKWRAQSAPGYEAAALAAMRAVEFALWRPGAAESVAGVAGDEVDVPEPEASLGPGVRRDERDDDAAWAAAAPRAPPVPEGPKSAPPGRLASIGRPGRPVAALPQDQRPIEDLVLEALAGGRVLDSCNIASMVDRKEMAVSSALSHLFGRELVTFEEAPPGSSRRYRWRLADGLAA